MRLTRLFLALPLVVACAAEPGDDTTPDAGRVYEKKIIRVTGSVVLHPLAEAWHTAEGVALPSLEGLTVNVEDALKAASSQPALKSGTTDAEGKFDVADVDVTNVSLALVASVDDPSETLAPCGYGLVRDRPEGDLFDMPVYVVTYAYLEHVVQATGLTAEDLLEKGLMFARVLDGEGNGVAGARLAKVGLQSTVIEGDENNPLWFPTEDFTGLEPSNTTSASGVMLYVPEFGAKEYTAIVDGREFEVKLAGARKGFVLSVLLPEQ